MTREEARKLLGGYATGSLSEAERKALFDAALEDQDLYEELAQEQAIRELIETPGVRARLVAALEPQPRRGWWIWGAAVAATAVGVVAFLAIPKSQPEPVEVAMVQNAPQPQPEIPAVQAGAPAQPERKLSTQGSSAPPPTPPPPAVPAPPPPVAQELAVDEIRALETARTDATQQPFAAASKTQADAVEAPKPAAPNPRMNALPGAAIGAQSKAPAPPLRDELLPNNIVRVTPTSAGTLEVKAGQQILFPRNPVVAGVALEIPIPEGVTELRMEFLRPNQEPVIVTVPVQR